MDFTGKVVIITGASAGIGATTAIQFSKLGASVVITGRNLDNLQKVGEECTEPLIIQADVTKDEDVRRIIDTTIENFGRLDVLVNNAGIFEIGCTETGDLEQFERIFNTNVRAVFYLTKLAIPHLVETKGNIVNVSSVAGKRCFTDFTIYSMSKGALDQFTKCLSLEMAPKGVRVNSIAPGVIVTDIFIKTGMTEEQVDNFYEIQNRINPLRRTGETRECADLITFLASDNATYINGENVSIDGGYQLSLPKLE